MRCCDLFMIRWLANDGEWPVPAALGGNVARLSTYALALSVRES